MNVRKLLSFVLATVAASAVVIGAAAQPVAMTVDSGKTGPSISPLMYGFFTELLNNWYEGGLWAEMLGDRKFFYPVDSSDTQAPPNSRRFAGRWRPVGPDDSVTMDPQRAWVGEHSPVIRLDATAPHGIQQAGLALVKGKQYSGHIILAADPGAAVTANLIWGPNPGDRQTVAIKGLRTEYGKFPVSFTAGADTPNARLEIAGTGKGSFHVGAVSLMPADNVNGFRADMIAALKDIGPTIFRWPGGNFTSGYDWRDGIGDADKRPPRYDFAWKALEPNDVGTDEFMALTTILHIEPYICVNDGFGDAHSAAEWVEYFNGANTTPMGKLRAANGHPESYHIKWWNIGNEMYGPWQLGTMSLAHYTIKHNMFAAAMRKVDPTIKIIASGATPAEMSTTGAARTISGKAVAEYGDPKVDWTGGLLANSAGFLDAIAEHLYPKANTAFDAEKQQFVPVDDALVDRARRLPNRVRCAVEAWQEYQKRFPALKMDSIPISLDEWIPGNPGVRSSMFTALSSAEAMHELFRNSGLFMMSAYTHAAGLLAYDKTSVNILPVGLMFKMYRQHFGTIPLAIAGNSPQHDVKGTVGVDKPKIPSGSDTYPLDAVAALTADRKAMTVAMVNATEEEHQIDVTFQGVALQPNGRLWRIASADLNPQNPAGKPRAVDIVESQLTAAPGRLTAPKLSISIYEFPVR